MKRFEQSNRMEQNKNQSIGKIVPFSAAVFLVAFLFLFSFYSHAAVSKNLNYQGLLANSAGVAVTDGSYTLHLKIYTVASGGSSIWSADQAVTTKNGIFSTLLDISSLNFNGTDFYLGVAVGSDAEMTPRKRIGSVPQAINANNLIGDGSIDISGGAKLGDNQYLNFGTTSGSSGYGIRDNNGTIEFKHESGSWSAISSSGGGTFVGKTASSYDGNFVSGGDTGYRAATVICAAEYSSSHFCQTGEILNSIAANSISGFSGTAWIAEGPPGYTANSNDCNGYTTNSNTYLGAFWELLSTNGGRGWLTNCSQTKPIACCR